MIWINTEGKSMIMISNACVLKEYIVHCIKINSVHAHSSTDGCHVMVMVKSTTAMVYHC